ncbi:MAG: ATP-binding cassette domain-containing protein [Paeniclostridium sordellii]|nr:ATP-binding cassette domain-containing protein [Paeniclostridium sordellii]
MESIYIEIRNLSKKIKGVMVLDNINMKLQKGKVYGFTGPNGSGKTMLFRSICGLIKPTEGTIEINNKKLHENISFPESVGALIENPGFLPNYSGRKNLKLIADIKGIIGYDEIDKLMDLIGLDLIDKKKYKQYSLGMKQKLGIAQALMEEPELIILDEPTNALDEKSIQNVLELIKEEKEKGKTILIASHDKVNLEKVSDVIFKMENGRIL